MGYEKDIMDHTDPETQKLKIDIPDKKSSRETAESQRFVKLTYIFII